MTISEFVHRGTVAYSNTFGNSSAATTSGVMVATALVMAGAFAM